MLAGLRLDTCHGLGLKGVYCTPRSDSNAVLFGSLHELGPLPEVRHPYWSGVTGHVRQETWQVLGYRA